MTADRTPTPDGPAVDPALGRAPVVDFARLGRRLRTTALWLGGLVLVTWLVAIPFRGVDVGLLWNLVGLALAVMFVAEVVIVGGSAMKGMLRAGEQGERLASSDVTLLPPQLSNWLARRAGRSE